jgi:hypothetical protein
MGKTAIEKRSAGTPPPGAGNGADASTPGTPSQAPAAAEPGEPLERARLLAEVARQRVRIAKEELKRARKRVKEAKREAKRARKQAAVARKAWKKARKAHRASPAPKTSGGRRKRPLTPKGPRRGAPRKNVHRRRAARGASESPVDGAPATHSSET